MKEYDSQLHKSVVLLEEIVYEVRDMVGIGMEEDITLLKRGWGSDNGEKVKDMCKRCQDDLFNISKNIENIIDKIK